MLGQSQIANQRNCFLFLSPYFSRITVSGGSLLDSLRA